MAIRYEKNSSMSPHKIVIFNYHYTITKFFCDYKILANDTNISELEKRVIYLEKQVEELKRNSNNDFLESKLGNLKKGINKINIKNDLGDPDRIGKYSNGDEIWGFKNFTLRFDKNGKLNNWSKPYLK